MSAFKQLSFIANDQVSQDEDTKIINIKYFTKSHEGTQTFEANDLKYSKQPVQQTESPSLWDQAIDKFKIQSIYKNCSIDNCTLLPESFVSIGKRWIKSSRKCSLYLHGNTGSGKTYFSLALFRAAVEFGVPWINFVRSYDLDEELLQSVESKQEKSVIRKYAEVPILFIDDLGVERVSERIQRQIYAIIDERLGENRLTVITSNLAVEDLPLGGRTISRLSSYYSIEFPEQDLRKRF